MPFSYLRRSGSVPGRPRAGSAPKFRQRRAWTANALEARQMLAADCGAAVSTAAEFADCGEIGTVEFAQQTETGRHIVVVDAAASGMGDWASVVPANAEMVLLDSTSDPIQQIANVLAKHRDVPSLHIVSHGSDGQIQLAGQILDQQMIETRVADLRAWSKSLTGDADVVLYGCDVASSLDGKRFVGRLAEILDADVAASSDRTGSSTDGNDWISEYQIGQIETSTLLGNAKLDRFQGHLAIEIYAAGQTTDELMELMIDGEIVDTWFVRDTDALAGQFLPYYYNVDGISADRIRINFANDQYDPANGVDRNLRIDKIVVDGTTYETEDPSVFSTGTWKPSDGVTPGFRQDEFLSSNGYFQFSSNGGGNGGGGANGSIITINAAGDTGDETMQLLVDGIVVQSYFNVPTGGQSYTFQSDQSLTADRIRVAFTDSVYRPDVGYDQNLRVDNIVLDGRTFESEDPATFSTATYVAGQGVTSGNLRSETLHANGYFQYGGNGNTGGGNTGGGNNGDSGSFSLRTSDITVIENQGSIELEVVRIGGSEGAASINIFTADGSATAGSDYVARSQTLFFASGQTSQTFRVDLIDDGREEGTEEFSVRIDNNSGAGLLAPRTSIVTLLDDDSGLPRYSSFDSDAGLALNGNANVNGGELELTAAGGRQVGTAFYQTPIAINSSTSFQSQFGFRVGGGAGTNGADGFTFLLQNSAAGTSAIGRAGGYMGYDNIENSLAIEFDNYLKGGPGASTVAVVVNGSTALLERAVPFDLNNGQQYYGWVDYNGDSNNLSVYVSTTTEKPNFAIFKTQVDLQQVVGDFAYAGFSAGNYDQPNFHRISRWNFSLDAPPSDPQVAPSGAIEEQDLYFGLNQPLNVEFSPDGRNIFVAEKGGVIKVARDGSSNLQTLLDISGQVNNVADRGLVDFAIHPDFQNNGFIYLSYTYDPPQVYDNVGNALAGPDGTGNRAGRLMRVQADASTGFTTIVAGSETILLGTASTWDNFNGFTDSTSNFGEPEGGVRNGQYVRDFIKSDSLSHTVGGLAFGTDGSLFVGIGDGSSYNQTDGRALSAQNLDSLSGKILRIDPFTGQGLSDNPFFNGDAGANRSKVYQLGLRNPWRLTVDRNSGQLYIGETGLSSFEELNTGGPGENFGWPFYEGGQGVNVRTPGYSGFGQAQAFYRTGAGKPASIALQHQAGSNVIVLGDILYDSDLGQEFEGRILYADLYRGGVAQAQIGANGEPFNGIGFVGGANFVVDMRQAPDGSLYYVNLLEGTVGKWVRG